MTTTVLPRDKNIQIQAPLDMPESTIIPSQVVELFINQAEYHWVMDFCICREGDGCQEYPSELGCLFLGEPVLGINPKLGRRVSKDEALAHIRKCQEQGLVHTIGRNRLDSIWLGTKPVEELLTICNCCPCCCLWGVIPDITPRISQKINAMPGVEVLVTEICQGCESCADGSCFTNAILMENGRAVITPACRGCGRCVDICPEGAIQLTIEGEHNIQAAIHRLERLID